MGSALWGTPRMVERSPAMSTKTLTLTVLGSGTCIPREDRGSPAFYLKIGQTKILLDCGPGTVRQLVKAGEDYKDIDLIIISHLHVDHTSDLPALFHALNYTPDFNRKKDILLLGGKGIRKFFDHLLKPFPHIQPRPFTYEINVVESKKIKKFDDFTVETTWGNHDSSSIIIKINAFGKSLVYTGDTDYDRHFVKFSKKADFLIIECSYPDQRKVEGHLTPRLAARMAAEAQVKSLLLTHFYPSADKIDIESQVKKYFSGKVIIARDFMVLKI